ncbi:NUDIX hydrolase [Nocardia yamanashiensis]|uniref:NUDIX hydrolase n=1 Tax=Nocardia yamanashiensis TaxID=209247 RepID=UPI000836C2EC|nr:NUDIX domain-containing protein [Nocardia yamanashiensis]
MATGIEGANVIITNPRGQILLFLRDDKPDIPFPNSWALPGGHVEPGETPLACLVREIDEEMCVQLDPATPTLLCSRLRPWGMLEHTFTTMLDLDLDRIVLTEGQQLGWFGATDIATIRLGFEEHDLLTEYFTQLRVTAVDLGQRAVQARVGCVAHHRILLGNPRH